MMVVAGGLKDAVHIPALGEAMSGSGTVPRLAGRVGMAVRARDDRAPRAIKARPVRTTVEQVEVAGRAPIRATTREAVTGNVPVPQVRLMGALAKIHLVRGPFERR